MRWLNIARGVLSMVLAVVIGAGVACEPTPRTFIVADSHGYASTTWPHLLPCPVEVRAWGGWALTTPTMYVPTPFDETMDILDEAQRGDMVVVALGFNDLGGTEDLAAARRRVETRFAQAGVGLRWTTLVPLSPRNPYPMLLPHMRARWVAWNSAVRAVPGTVDVAAPLGDWLTWPDDLDGVHATELAHRKIAAAVAGQVCP